jgi:chromate transporter
MLDGLGMAETTPGPLITVTQFVGFLGAYRSGGALNPLVAATLGAILTTWVTFVPCFLWIFLGAPFIERLRGNQALSGALTGITAAVVGVILNLAVWFSIHALFAQVQEHRFSFGTLDVPVWQSVNLAALFLTVAAAVAVFRLRWNMLAVLGGCAATGIVLRAAGVA